MKSKAAAPDSDDGDLEQEMDYINQLKKRLALQTKSKLEPEDASKLKESSQEEDDFNDLD